MRPDTTLRALFAEYTRFKLRGARENSRRKFGYALDHWKQHLGREPVLSDLTDEAVIDALWSMRETIAPPTVNGYAAKIRALWTFAARRGIVATWPDFEKLPTDEAVPIAFSREQVAAVFHAIDNTDGDIADIPARDWWRSLCLTLWDSAERITATLSSRWQDLNGDRLTIQAAARKGKLGRRRSMCYRLHPQTVESIHQIRAPRRELIWPWPKNASMLWYDWKRILTAADAIRQAMDHGGWRRTMANLPELIRLAHAGLDARHAALSELVSLSQEMGLYDAPETKTAVRNSDG